jgi:hypothetical protein
MEEGRREEVGIMVEVERKLEDKEEGEEKEK